MSPEINVTKARDPLSVYSEPGDGNFNGERHGTAVQAGHRSPVCYNNFGKYCPILIILSPVVSLENSLCMHHKDFYLTCDMFLHHLVKFENPKSYQIFALNVTVYKLN